MAARRSSKFNAFKCLQPEADEVHRVVLQPPITDGSVNIETPMIALVNGLSGGRKGERVQEILQQQDIPTFVALLSSSKVSP